MTRPPSVLQRLTLRILHLAGLLVPPSRRSDWIREWEAELISRRTRLRKRDQLTAEREIELLLRVLGSLRHAWWLRKRKWREQMFVHDIRLAVRALYKQIGFTAIVLATLVLGIGVNTAIFTIVDNVLLEPLPYADSGELHMLVWRSNQDPRITSIPYLDYLDLRDQSESFDDLALWTWFGGTLQTRENPLQVWGYQVSPNLLSLLGVEPLIGRRFTQEESEQAAQVAMLSYGLWQDRFGGDPTLPGKSVHIDDRPYTVVGILPPDLDLQFPRRGAQLWVPLDPGHSWTSSRSIYTYYCLGRVKDEISLERLNTDLAALSNRLQADHPETNQDRLYYGVPFLELVLGESRPQLMLLSGAVGLVLLIVCANLTNLLLARGLGRSREMALRQALGAGRIQIIRQLLVESTVLCLLGGLGGVLASWLLLPFVLSLAPQSLPRAGEIGVDARVLLFSLAVILLTGILAGILPAIKSSGVQLRNALQEGGPRVASAGGWRPFLVTAEIALALTLMAGAGLLVGSLVRVLQQDPGFSTENAISLQIGLPASRYATVQDVWRFLTRAKTTLETQPGIASMGVVSSLPLSGHNTGSALSIEGKPLPESQLPTVGWQFISPDYPSAAGIALVAGRGFEEQDLGREIHYSLINRAAADLFFPGENPIGRRIETGVPSGEWHEIIGIVENVRHLALDQPPEPRVYDLLGQHWGRGMFVVIRGRIPPDRLMEAARLTFHDLDPALPLQDVKALDELIRDSTQSRRFLIQLLGLFGALALVLAAVGIYGVISFWVNQRSRELGVRLALGASRIAVIRLVLQQILWITAAGIALGWLASWGSARMFASLLFEVRPGDPMTLAAVTLLLVGVILVAAYIPARRAATIDPLESLRAE